MSLSKQLSWGFFIILLSVFVGSLWVNVNNTRDFIQQQLQSHSQDTATSLGLSITPYLDVEEDLAIIDTMTNAIFDRGYYQSIEIRNTQDEVLLRKENPKLVEQVPSWFMSLFPLQAPLTSTELNSGWNLAGSLTVESNPGFGYMQLWRNALETFWVITALFIIGLFFVWLLVKAITKPITDVVQQAHQISNKQFDVISEIPKMPEMKVFVVAINTMAGKLSTMFEQITQQSEKYRQFAYSDSLTSVGNRRAFDLAFKQILRDKESNSQGHLVVIRLTSLAHVSREYGNEAGDLYLTTVCEEIKTQCQTALSQFSIYRISGADFALLLEYVDHASCEKLVTQLSDKFKNLEKSEYSSGTAHIGITEYQYGMTYGATMEKVDSALAIAETTAEKWQFASALKLAQSNHDWRQQIQTLLDSGTSDFASQPIFDGESNIVYQEWFARLKNQTNGELIPMAQLIPASIRLDVAGKLDGMIITAALSKMSLNMQDVGLNLSRLTLLNLEFQKWFVNQLPENELCKKLVLEIPERAIVNDVQQLSEFLAQLKEKGVRITVERFGAQLAGIRHLREIKPDFLKLDGRFIRNIHSEEDNQLFVQSLVSIAHGLNIKVIAEMVESEEEYQWLKSVGVDYQQGYYLAAPKVF